MKSIVSSGLICIKDKLNIEYVVCKIDYFFNDDETFKYVFTPYYNVIDLLDSDIFQGIPGLNLDLKKECYIRENIIPTFISERVPQNNREDLYELLQEVNMNYMNPVEYLIRTKKMYCGDSFYVVPYKECKDIYLNEIVGKCNVFGIIKIILSNMTEGNKIFINDKCINDIRVFISLKYLYSKQLNELNRKQRYGIDENRNKYLGRKPLKINELVLREEFERVEKGVITNEEAIKKLQISKSTYYR